MSTRSKQQLIYLVYGDNSIFHDEARFSITSALFCQRQEASENFDIRVYTDQVNNYADLPVITHILSAQQLGEMYGHHNYNHRSKLCVLQLAAPWSEKTVFIDSDTFFLRSPQHLFDAVNEQQTVTDEIKHAPLSQIAGFTSSEVARIFKQRNINTKRVAEINSGIFGFHYNNAPAIQSALDLLDEVYIASNKRFTSEQFVLGIAIGQRSTIVADAAVLKHYWSRKNIYRAKGQHFLMTHTKDLLGNVAMADFSNISAKLSRPPRITRLKTKALAALSPHCKQFFTELLYGSYDYKNIYDACCKHAWWLKARDNYFKKNPSTDHRQLIDIFTKPLTRFILGKKNTQEIAYFFATDKPR